MPSRKPQKKTAKSAKATPRVVKPSKATTTDGLPSPLESGQAFRGCPETAFSFKTTAQLGKSHDIIAQARAVRAINMGLGIRKPGYNIYVAGVQGTGKTSVIRTFLEKWSADAASPNDWLYVYNFNTPEAPRAIEMPKGEARKFKKKMEHLVKTLREEIPAALQGEAYENAVNALLSTSNERKSKLYVDLERLAKTMQFQIKSTRMGIETIPIVDGRAISEKEYNKLDEAERNDIENRRARLEPEVLDFARKVRAIEQDTKQYVEKLRSEVGLEVVTSAFEALLAEYKDTATINEYLEAAKADVLERLLDFVEDDEDAEDEDFGAGMEERDRFRRYSVNAFIDNTQTNGAPVIIENNPTYYNLFGKIEKNVEHGIYHTDFTMIKCGAVHRANGGYLVLNALDIFRTPQIWESLKRVLKNRQGFIEDMGEQYSLLPTSGLRPEPVPLDLKVIMIGNDDVYHTLFDFDEDFQKIFKIKADFDHKMERSQENIDAYVSFVATRCAVESLLPFEKSGIAAIVEHGSRLVEDQRLLSTRFGELKDLTIEADFIAREQEAKAVGRVHVEAALDQKYYRLNLVEEHLLEMVRNEDILLTVDGQRIGQVNGLAVYDMGDISFGKLGRITCTTSISDDGVINVERASKLSGKIHDKGVHIISGFLNGILAREHKLGVAASICFEQSYGLIDGDSASIAELVAILSAMAGLAVKQNFAMTGSINQLGDVQPIGGVNEKIEGFYKVARMLGKASQGYGVIIPWQNAPNLMLHKDVRKALDSGFLSIYPVSHIREAFVLATGMELGLDDFHAGNFRPGSALERIDKALDGIRRREHHMVKEMLEAESHLKARRTAKGRMSRRG